MPGHKNKNNRSQYLYPIYLRWVVICLYSMLCFTEVASKDNIYTSINQVTALSVKQQNQSENKRTSRKTSYTPQIPVSDSSGFRVYQPQLIPAPSSLQELQADLALILDSPDLLNAHIGVSVFNIEDNEEIFKFNNLKNFVPASVNKLFITAASLELLGSSYAYQTDLYLSGDLALDGRFIGDLIIKGSGDPTLSEIFHEDPTVIFDDWIQQLKLLGIKSIVGNIIGDDSFFDSDYYAVGWDYMDLKKPFAAQVNALSIFENKVEISIIPPDKPGGKPEYYMFPENTYLEVYNYLQTAQPHEKSIVTVLSEPNSNLVELYGNIYNEDKMDIKQEDISVSNPTLFFLELLRARLEEFEIALDGELVDYNELDQEIDYSTATRVPGWISPPIKEIIKEVNKSSNNLIAEMLLKTIAKEKTGVGSYSNGTNQLAEYLISKGINPSMILLKDGSGLSRNNLVSPYVVSKLLTSIYKSKSRDHFMTSLAKPGEKGTLHNRLLGSDAERKVFAKTGSMNNVSTLAGYIKTKNNKTLAFSILVNNFTVPISVVRSIQDLLVMRMVNYSQ